MPPTFLCVVLAFFAILFVLAIRYADKRVSQRILDEINAPQPSFMSAAPKLGDLLAEVDTEGGEWFHGSEAFVTSSPDDLNEELAFLDPPVSEPEPEPEAQLQEVENDNVALPAAPEEIELAAEPEMQQEAESENTAPPSEPQKPWATDIDQSLIEKFLAPRLTPGERAQKGDEIEVYKDPHRPHRGTQVTNVVRREGEMLMCQTKPSAPEFPRHQDHVLAILQTT